MRLFLKVLFILLGITCGHNVNAAAAPAGRFDAAGRRIARVRVIRNTELTPAEISGVIDEGRCLPGKSRQSSITDVYHRLYTEYCRRSDNPENRISRLLNLAKLINDDNFDFPGRFFNSRVSLYAFVCREAGIWTEKTDTRRMFKSQLSLRAAHLHMGIWHETGGHPHLEYAYNLFGQAYRITKNKYGLPRMAKIIMDHGFLAGNATREGALMEAGRLLRIFSEPRSTLPPVAPGERARDKPHVESIFSEKLRMSHTEGLAEELKARIAGAINEESEDTGSTSSSSAAAAAVAAATPGLSLRGIEDKEEEEEEEEYDMGPLSVPAATVTAAIPAPIPAPAGWGQAHARLTSNSSSSAAAAVAAATPGLSLRGVEDEEEEEEEYDMGPLPAPVGWGHAHAGLTSSSSSAAAAVAAAAPLPTLDEGQPSIEALQAEFRSRMRSPRTDRRRVVRPASSSVLRVPMEAITPEEREENPFPMRIDDGMGSDRRGSHIDRETKAIFGPDIQRIMRYKLLYPEKSNIVIASDLGLPRQAVAQVLS